MISFLSGLVFYWLAVFLSDRIKYKNPNYGRLVFFMFGAFSRDLIINDYKSYIEWHL